MGLAVVGPAGRPAPIQVELRVRPQRRHHRLRRAARATSWSCRGRGCVTESRRRGPPLSAEPAAAAAAGARPAPASPRRTAVTSRPRLAAATAANRRQRRRRPWRHSASRSWPSRTGSTCRSPAGRCTARPPTRRSPGPSRAQPVAPDRGAAAGAEATVELPIFREMEAAWFRSHGTHRPGPAAHRETRAAGGDPAPAARHAAAQSAQRPAGSTRRGSAAGPPTQGRRDDWRTAADDGLARAPRPQRADHVRRHPVRSAQARSAGAAGARRRGDHRPPVATGRRAPRRSADCSPAYHRGVQRGRGAGAPRNGKYGKAITGGDDR